MGNRAWKSTFERNTDDAASANTCSHPYLGPSDVARTSPFDRDGTMSMQAVYALAERWPHYDRPEVENADYLFLTAMRDPWTKNKGIM